MQRFTARPATADTHLLAEGPVWDPERQRVLWVDVDAGHVLEGRLVTDGDTVSVTCTRRHQMNGTAGAVVSAADGTLLVAGQQTLTIIAPDGERWPGPRIVPAGTRSRLNDGGCDPAGRFLVGSMALDDRTGADVLARIEDDQRITLLDDDLTLSNGLAWSPGGEFYSVDSVPGIVWVRGYDAATGVVGERREFLRVIDAIPDGLCVDADGNLWLAIWGAGQVRCYSPGGEQLATVTVAAPHTSSIAFAGPDLDTLLITTAQSDLSAQQLADFPDSGRLFSVRVGTTGLPATPWSGWSGGRPQAAT